MKWLTAAGTGNIRKLRSFYAISPVDPAPHVEYRPRAKSEDQTISPQVLAKKPRSNSLGNVVEKLLHFKYKGN